MGEPCGIPLVETPVAEVDGCERSPSLEGRGWSRNAGSRRRLWALNATTSFGARACAVLLQMVMVPMALGSLGTERFGIWMTILSLSGVAAFADLGIGNGLLNTVAGADGENDRGGLRKAVSSGFFLALAMALVLALGLMALHPFVPWHRVLNAQSAAAKSECSVAVAIFWSCTVAALPLSIVQKAQTGFQESYLNDIWTVLGHGASVAALTLVVSRWNSLPLVIAAVGGGSLIGLAANSCWQYGRRRPWLWPRLRWVDATALKSLLRIGALFSLLQILAVIWSAADSVIVAQILGPEAVAKYVVTGRLFSIAGVAASCLLSPLWPIYRRALAEGDRSWVERTLHRSMATTALVVGSLSAVLLATAGWLVPLWTGKLIDAPIALTLAFAIWNIVQALTVALAMYWNAAGLVRFELKLAIVAVTAGLILKVALCRLIGLPGMPIAAALSFGCAILSPGWLAFQNQRRMSDTSCSGARQKVDAGGKCGW